MCIFGCDRASPIEKALHYIPMQVLVDRKLKNGMLKFLFYSERTLYDEVIFLVEKLKF